MWDLWCGLRPWPFILACRLRLPLSAVYAQKNCESGDKARANLQEKIRCLPSPENGIEIMLKYVLINKGDQSCLLCTSCFSFTRIYVQSAQLSEYELDTLALCLDKN